jgi:hypothetical protein
MKNPFENISIFNKGKQEAGTREREKESFTDRISHEANEGDNEQIKNRIDSITQKIENLNQLYQNVDEAKKQVMREKMYLLVNFLVMTAGPTLIITGHKLVDSPWGSVVAIALQVMGVAYLKFSKSNAKNTFEFLHPDALAKAEENLDVTHENKNDFIVEEGEKADKVRYSKE